MDGQDISTFLKHDSAYTGRTVVLPLGVRCKVPQVAGRVDLAAELDSFAPALAGQVRHPSELLLRQRDRPQKLKKPFVRLDLSYPQLVDKAVASGLQQLRRLRRVARHHGKPIINGGFAAPKDEEEDRLISADVPINQLLDPAKLPRRKFAYIPRLRA
eukprot:11291160-Karenia_brevis.AAC.1